MKRHPVGIRASEIGVCSGSAPDEAASPEPAPNRRLKMSCFYKWEEDVLVLNILGTPGASKDAIGKVKGNQLKVSVTAAPRVGRATDHMVRFLAGEFGVSQSAIEVVFGRKNVNKQLRIKAPARLPACIELPEASSATPSAAPSRQSR